LQEVVMQRVSYHFGGAQGMDVPNIVGVVAFVVIIFFGAQLLKRSQQPKSHFIPLNDHVRKGRYRQMGGKTRRPVHVNVESTAAKPFVDGEFWDASERRVQWSCYEMEKTSPGGKASPRILKKSKYAGVGMGTGAQEEVEDMLAGEADTGSEDAEIGVGTGAGVVTWPGVGEGAEPEVVLGTIWVPHPKHGRLVRRSARLVSRSLR
jgi:hypothetical protein